MDAKPLTSEAIALTEKKMDMTLDDIIKLSKKSTSKVKKQRVPNKSRKFLNSGPAEGNSSKIRRFMDSRSSLRQGVLAQRRSNFHVNQFPLITEVARRAAAAPLRNRAINRNNHSRVTNWNKPRVGVQLVQGRAGDGGYAAKQKPQASILAKHRGQTLDSLFASMKEKRLRELSNNARWSAQQKQFQGRGRFGNFAN